MVFAILALAWGVLAFGAVYPWAYWPLFGMAVAIGVAGLSSRRTRRRDDWPLALSLLLLIAAVGLQLVPLPRGVLTSLSPHADRLLRDLDIGYAAGLTLSHPLSLDPASTWLGLAALVSLSIFAIGLSRLLSTSRTRLLANGIVAVGSLVALIGIVQHSTGTYRIYGFWTPYDHPYQIFGPFVNKNHFAGWMTMTMAVTIGVLCGHLATAMRGVRRDWRSRLLWFSSPQASQLLLVAGAVVVMAFAIVLTRSRSGIICLGVVVVLSLVAVLKEVRASGRRARALAAGAAISLLAIAAVAWAGVAPVMARLQNEPALGGRLDAWRAAIRMASDFPVAGVGVNAFAAAMLFYQPAQLTARWDVAHNDYVQLAAEGGWLLVFPIALCVAVVAVRMRRGFGAPQNLRNQWIRTGAVVGIIGIAVQEAADFSLQLPGVALLFAALVAIAIHRDEVDTLSSNVV